LNFVNVHFHVEKTTKNNKSQIKQIYAHSLKKENAGNETHPIVVMAIAGHRVVIVGKVDIDSDYTWFIGMLRCALVFFSLCWLSNGIFVLTQLLFVSC
jgi:hypothetical protein